MTTDTDDPRPAATEAAMIQDVQATLDDMEAHDVALTAGNLIDALDYHGIRLATAPPSGRVCVSRETAVRIWQRLPERNLTITTGSDPDLMEFARAIALSEGAAK